MDASKFQVTPGKRFKLKNHDPSDTGGYKQREEASRKLERDIQDLAILQDILYAQGSHALLIILQAMDAAGKDSVIKHVMSGVNPQGCQVISFKQPSAEELSHDYLWRSVRSLPARGRIGIFNRSYYEEVLVVRVHPEFLKAQHVSDGGKGGRLWQRRYREINNFEQYLTDNGTLILKFFLHISRKEQKARIFERIDTPEKNWKFSLADLAEREHWDSYMEAYEDALAATSTECAPWYIMPADHKWFTRVAVADIIVKALRSLRLQYPEVTSAQKKDLRKAKRALRETSR